MCTFIVSFNFHWNFDFQKPQSKPPSSLFYTHKKVVQPSWLSWLTMAKSWSESSSQCIIHSTYLWSFLQIILEKNHSQNVCKNFFWNKSPPPQIGCKNFFFSQNLWGSEIHANNKNEFIPASVWSNNSSDAIQMNYSIHVISKPLKSFLESVRPPTQDCSCIRWKISNRMCIWIKTEQ